MFLLLHEMYMPLHVRTHYPFSWPYPDYFPYQNPGMKTRLLLLTLLLCSFSYLQAQYCTPATSSGGVFISQVNFNSTGISSGLNYSTGSSGFSFTPGSAGTMQRNCEVVLPVTISNPGGTDRDVTMALFIDYNADNDFDDAGETVVNYSNTVTASSTLNASLNFTVVPFTSSTLRVRIALRQGNTAATACDAYTGEVEDYVLSVPANSAPVLNSASNPFINSLVVTQTDNEGISVGDLINSSTAAAFMTDAESCVAKGIAIIATSGAHGDWEYILPNGTWAAMGAVSSSNALLLAQDETGLGTRIRFNPTGTGTATIEVRAWDQSEGINGAYVNIAATGGTSAFSSNSKIISHNTVSAAAVTGNASVFMPIFSSYSGNFNLRSALLSRSTGITQQSNEITADNFSGSGNDVAVDFINNKVVWIGGSSSSELLRSNYDGSSIEVLDNSNLSAPSGVAVGAGKIFVADNGTGLFSFNPDGTGITAITGGAGQANNIGNTGDIEFNSGKIYYINQPVVLGDYFIVQANADGTGTVNLYNTPNTITGLAIAGSNMYWTEWDEVNTAELLSRNISSGTVNTLASQTGQQYRDLLVDANNSRIYFISIDQASGIYCKINSIPLSGGSITARLTLSDVVYSMALSADLSVLPVRYLSVEASKHNQQVLLQWKVGSEINVLRYAVQRSADGQQFTSIGEVVATGRSQYTFTDVQPLKGNAYYRIVNTDKDGRLQYSNVVLLSVTPTAAVQWYPTLIQQNTVTLQTSNMAAGKYSYTLLNMQGQILQQQSLQLMSNAVQQIQLPAALPAGTYQIRLQNETQRWVQTLIKQ